MWETLEVSASGYYVWTARPDSPTEQWRAELVGAIEEIHAEVKHRYGSPRMTAELKARGYECSENTVRVPLADGHPHDPQHPRRRGRQRGVPRRHLAQDQTPRPPGQRRPVLGHGGHRRRRGDHLRLS